MDSHKAVSYTHLACLTKGDVGNINFKSSDSMIEATKLSFTDKQASAILDLKLYRLIGLEILMLKEEYEEILAKIEEYEDCLLYTARCV